MIPSSQVCDLLQSLGVTANYTGFFHLGYAVQLCKEEPEYLMLVTKRVYPEVAKKFHTSCCAVERNIRTVGNIIWEQKRHTLECVAGRSFIKKPSNTQLLAILSQHCIRNSQYP